MRNKVLQSNNLRDSRKSVSSRTVIKAAALFLLFVLAAAAVFCYLHCGWLTLRNADTGQAAARYFVWDGDWFSVGFIHSVNNSPLTDYYELRNHTIYVEKTVYYGFGAGVQTELEDGQKLEYGEDGSMIVSGFHKEIPDLLYIVGTVSDHTMVINGGPPVSLSKLCGARQKVRFTYDSLF